MLHIHHSMFLSGPGSTLHSMQHISQVAKLPTVKKGNAPHELLIPTSSLLLLHMQLSTDNKPPHISTAIPCYRSLLSLLSSVITFSDLKKHRAAATTSAQWSPADRWWPSLTFSSQSLLLSLEYPPTMVVLRRLPRTGPFPAVLPAALGLP